MGKWKETIKAWENQEKQERWTKRVLDRTKALQEKPLPSPLWKEKVEAWQDREKAELLAQHRETTAAMKELARETEARRKEHIAKLHRYAREHGIYRGF